MTNQPINIFLIIILFFIIGRSFETIFVLWYFFRFLLLLKIYSHIRFILLTLELITLIRLILLLVTIIKSGIEIRFFFFFLCLIVGEARLGLRLIVMRSRFQRTELTSLNLS